MMYFQGIHPEALQHASWTELLQGGITRTRRKRLRTKALARRIQLVKAEDLLPDEVVHLVLGTCRSTACCSGFGRGTAECSNVAVCGCKLIPHVSHQGIFCTQSRQAASDLTRLLVSAALS